MQELKISDEDYRKCNDLVTIVGLALDTTSEYERHFASNKKIVTIYKNIIFEVGPIKYCDSLDGDIQCGNLVLLKRRMLWKERFLELKDNTYIDCNVIDYLIQDGLNDGFPIGLIPGDEDRKMDLLMLGRCVQDKFCKIINYKNRGEIRIYDDIDKYNEYFIVPPPISTIN